MSKNMTKAGLAAIVVAAAAISGAQTNGPTGFSVRLGAFFPNTGDSKLNVGLDYKINSVRVEPVRKDGPLPSYLGISVDYYGDGDAFAIPVALTYNVRASRQVVLSAGIGPEFLHASGFDETNLAGQVGASYEFATEGEGSNPIFVQAKYFISRRDGAKGFSVGVGYRF